MTQVTEMLETVINSLNCQNEEIGLMHHELHQILEKVTIMQAEWDNLTDKVSKLTTVTASVKALLLDLITKVNAAQRSAPTLILCRRLFPKTHRRTRTYCPDVLTSETSPEGPPHAGAAQFPWMKEAWRCLGAHERPGLASDPLIAAWAAEFNIVDFKEDTEPYCALLPRWCFHKTLPDEPLPPHPKWSWGWRTFGIECVPQLGCVLTYYRGKIEEQKGHNQFYLTETADDYIGIGANQSDTVSVKRMPKARLLGSRWPKTWPLPNN